MTACVLTLLETAPCWLFKPGYFYKMKHMLKKLCWLTFLTFHGL